MQNFVAFSEYMNFKNIPERWLRKDEASEFKDLDLDLDKINKLIDAAEKVRIFKSYFLDFVPV